MGTPRSDLKDVLIALLVGFIIGEAYRQIEEFPKALEHFSQCMELSPDHQGAQLMAAVVQEELKHFDQAKKLYHYYFSYFREIRYLF